MSKLKDEVDLLRSIPMFQNLPANKLKLLAFASDRVSYGENEVLFNQGDPADAAYVFITGEADVLVSTGGEPGKVAALGPNSIVGDMAVLCDIPRTATIKTNVPTEALRIRKEHIMELISDSPSFALEVLKETMQRLAKTTIDLSEARVELAELRK